MTLIEQQRLIGAGLLLVIISAVSYFLISGANSVNDEIEVAQPEQSFTSVVQPISEAELEVVDYVEETLLDPQNLNQAPMSEQTENVEASVEVVEQVKSLDKPAIPPVQKEESVIEITENWVLQLGSFSVKNNADALVTQLKQLGYQPTIETSNTDKGAIYRVRLAAIKTKAIAETMAQELAKKLKLSPQVFQQKS